MRKNRASRVKVPILPLNSRNHQVWKSESHSFFEDWPPETPVVDALQILYRRNKDDPVLIRWAAALDEQDVKDVGHVRAWGLDDLNDLVPKEKLLTKLLRQLFPDPTGTPNTS